MMNQLQDSKKDFLLVSFVSSNLQQLNSSQSIFRSFIVFSTTQQKKKKIIVMVKVLRKSNWKDLTSKEEKNLAMLYHMAFDEELNALESKGLATTLR